ncbi:MAG: hypothetical protein ABR540_17090 [Acidimicrobiales bacterium]
MALNALQEQRCQSIGLDNFFEHNRAKYKAMAAEAFTFTATTLSRSNQIVRQDDVSGHLEAAIELDEPLKVHLFTKKKSQQYWTRYFTFLILDRLWEELRHGN